MVPRFEVLVWHFLPCTVRVAPHSAQEGGLFAVGLFPHRSRERPGSLLRC